MVLLKVLFCEVDVCVCGWMDGLVGQVWPIRIRVAVFLFSSNLVHLSDKRSRRDLLEGLCMHVYPLYMYIYIYMSMCVHCVCNYDDLITWYSIFIPLLSHTINLSYIYIYTYKLHN